MSDLLELIATNCVEHPTAAAVGRPDGTFLDHAALHRVVVAMGDTLRSVAIARGDRVALCLPDALQAAVAFIAVATHAVCAPMNPRYRRVEIEFHLKDLGICALVVPEDEDPPALDVATRLGVQILRLACDERGLPFALRADRIVARHKTIGVTDQALLLHTSGTTARPKIVALSHANLITSSQNIARSLALTPRDRCLNVMPLFHIHGLVGALLASIASGSSVALPRTFEPTCFFDWLDACQASWYTAVPPIHQAVLAMAPHYPAVLARRHLRFVRSSSAALAPTIMAALERAFDAPVVEAYGMTEASHQIAINPLPPGIRKPGSVGLPAGPDIAIAGEDGGILSREAQGEICIRGETVMTAYEHNDDANARAFHDGWLRTGDQGFFDADGYLHISGRLKEMINRGGEKVSPMEVEAALLQHAAIAEAAVFSVPHPTLGEDVAAAIVLHTGTSIAESDLRHWLRGSLTDAKVPQQIIIVDSLPRSPTGKVQRLLLAAALQDRLCAAYLAPRTPTESTVADIWREVLGLERVGVLDNFLALGGDSLKAVTVISRLRQGLGVEVALASLFAQPVLAEFAESVGKAARSVLPPITAARRDQPLPLSFAQQRLWFLAQMQGINNAYHVPLRMRLIGELDVGALHRALDRLIARHEALRTSFSNAHGEPAQRIAREDSGFELQQSDLRQHSDAATELQRLAIEEADTAFDLQFGPLIRGRLVRLNDREHVLLITLHHIVSDGWSMGVLTHELSVLYGAYRQGQPDPLPRLSIQYPDYALWQRRWLNGEVLRTQSDYWQRTLADAPAVLELPADRHRPAQQDYAGAFVALKLDQELTGQLKALSRRHGATLFMTLLAGWAVLLARLSGQDDVVIGVPAANRGRAEIEPLIGLFVNSLALRLDFSGSPTVGEALQRVKARAMEAQQHQDLPFEQVVELLRPARSLSHSPVFQVMFAWQNAGAADPEMPGLTVARVTTPHSVAKFDITLNLAEADGCITGGLEYATALFDRATVERHAGYLRMLLYAMAADDTQAVDRLTLLNDAERHRLVVGFNETQAPVASAGLIHQLFEEQVQHQPDALALVFEEWQLTYGELNARANQLAHHLIALGVRPDDRVAICIERSLEMVVGLLGILKAGGAYVPLEASNPADRLAYLLKDSAPLVVLTQHRLRRTLPAVTVPVVELDLQDQASIIARQPQHDPDASALGLKSTNIAYVIYTSGSTGEPKGVMVEHRNLVASTNARRQSYGPLGQFLLLSSIAFDSSVAGIFGALTTLQPLRIAGTQLSRDAAALIDEIARHQIGCLLCIPSLYRQLRQQIVRRGQLTVPLRVIVAGEVCPPDIAEPIATDGLSVEVFNEYGPTECTVWASVYPCRSSPAHLPVPIGRPISNTRIYILDRYGEPVPIGVAGEIHIGGAGVARGYLNRPQLTAQRFVADPFAPAGDARMYRTGDLGRYLPDGNIEFLGRSDFQVKIRGFRIELGEIEAQMAQHPAVREAVVLAREDGADKRLVAYYTVAPDAATVGAEALRWHLSATLPEYMLPVAYVRVDALPLTANGKLDRQALPLPDDDTCVARGYEAPVGEIESRLAQLWAELLELERVGRNDNFFELGGHSLAAMRLVDRVASTFDVQIGVAELFASPTIREFAIRVSKADAPCEPWNIVHIPPLGEKTPIDLEYKIHKR